MGILDRHLTEIAERIMEHVDLDEVTKDVLSRLVVTDLDLYFVVDQQPGRDVYEFVGMAYNREAAETLLQEVEGSTHVYDGKILRVDLGMLLTLAERAGAAEEVA